ncbi:MAG TPA: NADH-quinone oxidoreductase subunit A [Edaphobacter sp.]|jgi:NADH-quinone oxidoreductase subunit A|nr:NADH-quinone oxidoreductase subunit A [Edaphobacter sp.]
MNSIFADIYRPIGILVVAAMVFALSPLAMAWLWSRKFSLRKPGPVKNSTYECGLESKEDIFLRFRPEYYLYAIVFLIFDVEAIFLLPFAVAFAGLSVGASIAMLIFLLLLVEGLVWTWRKGILVWV